MSDVVSCRMYVYLDDRYVPNVHDYSEWGGWVAVYGLAEMRNGDKLRVTTTATGDVGPIVTVLHGRVRATSIPPTDAAAL